MDLLVKLAVVALAAAAVWQLFQPRTAFVVAVEGGVGRVVRGKATARFVGEVAAICADGRVTRGRVKGLWRGRTVRLTFSADIPPRVHQRIRNAWHAHG
jgi:hypothetical protein